MVWMLLIGVLFLSQSLVYGAAVDLEKLGDKDQPQTVLLESDFRDIDLVVFNDLYDIRWQDRAFYHRVWQKIGSPDIRQTFAMDMLVLLALAEGQIVVCPKKMWRCIAFLHDFFVDVQGLSVAEILQKHQLPDSFQRLLIKYKSRFMAYNNLSLTLDDDDSFCFLPKDDDFSVAALLFLFGFDHLYQIFLQQHYQCKEVNDLYVVFIPQGTLDKHNQAVQKSTVTSLDCIAPGLTALDMSLGMHWSTLPDYRHQEDWRLQETKLLDQRASEGLSFTELGAFLKDALQKLLINKNSISKSFQRFIPVVLPYFNFYMHGHGSARDKIVGIHTDDLGVILQRLQHQVNTHSVGLVSCYIGGKRFNDVFGHSYQSLNSWVDQITYPILFGGSFFALTCAGFDSLHRRFRKEPQKYNYYNSYFSCVHSSVQDYFKALDILQGSTFWFLDQRYSVNYGSIKLPYMGWVSAAVDTSKIAANLTAVRVNVRADQSVDIPQGKEYVLMNTNNISATVLLPHMKLQELPKFLPVNYANQCYHFAKIDIPNLASTTYTIRLMLLVLEQFFFKLDLEGLRVKEKIVVVIDMLQIGSLTVENVVCDISMHQGMFAWNGKCFEFGYKDRAVTADKPLYDMGKELFLKEIDKDVFMRDVDFYKRKSQQDSFHVAGLKKEFLESLGRCLKPTKLDVPDQVARSYKDYATMSDEAKEANIFRKKPKIASSVILP